MTMDDTIKRRSTPSELAQSLSTIDGEDDPSILRAFEEFTESRVLAGPEDRPDRPPLVDPDTPLLRKKRVLTWQEIPGWQQDNEYILTGYRR